MRKKIYFISAFALSLFFSISFFSMLIKLFQNNILFGTAILSFMLLIVALLLTDSELVGEMEVEE